ncbi:hypothetical protein DY000_02053647 [Brassica cretica]|uniref:Uncharacterized protein n=1 Tax=Brassica cretica TaxID=69181 RepID=A0ABQ7AH39_BRACR|nr:hypothetical protein DY000_02053647 [Brassica cretica]
MEGSPYRKFSFSQRKGAVPGTGPGVLRSGNPEAGVLPGVWRNSIPEYFSPTPTSPTYCGCSSERPRKLKRTLGECSMRPEIR